MPHPEGVLLCLSKLDRILAIDPLARTARVEPGVSNLAISEAAAAHGLYYAPDPSSQVACSIGGNVAANSGGVHCLKYGLTVHNVIGLELLTVDGDTLRVGGDAPDAPGYDLLALLTGSEGLLAVVTEVTVRLLPRRKVAIDLAVWQRALTLRQQHPTPLSDPRALTRFLCGLSSPALVQSKLTKEELFGALAYVPFQEILRKAGG